MTSDEHFAATAPGAEVVLVCMPFLNLARPSLALSLLKALLARDGITASVDYACLRFAEIIGPATYFRLIYTPTEKLVGEWIFSKAAFGDSPGDARQLLACLTARGLHDYLVPEDDPLLVARAPLAEEAGKRWAEHHEHVRLKAVEHVGETARRILTSRPRIVGCTSTFQQHAASLALLKRIRELDPEVVTMMGGANCETRMGRATHANFPWIDFMVSGDADGLIGPLCRAILEHGRELEASDLPVGVLAPVHRETGYPAGAPGGDGVPRAVFHDMDSLPYPNFEDYFTHLRGSFLAEAIDVGLVMETARGCWWGAISHCTFCGLNGIGMGFRSKSPQRALDEMEWLAERWGIRSLELADNILDMKYFDTVLPELARSEQPWEIFYETKSNLNRSQVRALSAAGIRWIQPGIESLSTQVLDTMGKGSKSSINVLLLKWARESGVQLSWNLLWGFPGEEDAWYAEMAELVPLMVHFQPPFGLPKKIRYDRYSPHFNRADDFGLSLSPVPMMSQIYPVPAEALQDLTYFFVDTTEEEGPPPERPGALALSQAVREWNEVFHARQPKLTHEELDGGLLITDTRPCAVTEHRLLDPLESAIYRSCEEGAGARNLPSAVARRLPTSSQAVESAVAELIEARLMVRLDHRLISLAARTDAPDWPYSGRFPGGAVDSEKSQQIEARLHPNNVIRLLTQES